MNRIKDKQSAASGSSYQIPFYAKRFVAGTTPEDAVTVAQKLSAEKVSSTLDLLGENVTDIRDSEGFTKAYINLLDSMKRANILPYISVKLTMLGLDLDEHFCRAQIEKVMAHADSISGRVCLDMEGSAYTERTLALYEHLCRSYTAPEIVLQAYLHRTTQDIERVLNANGKIRLCKGAYKEKKEVALQSMPEIRKNYLVSLERLLSAGKRICIATHDDHLIEKATQLIDEKKVGHDRYEFQMLYGLRESTWHSIARQGHNMTVYVPYGTDWQAYYKRRLAERKENVFFILKNFFKK